MGRRASVALLTVLIGSIGSVAHAQTAIYHLHKEVSATNSAYDQLQTANPDAASIAVASADMKNTTAAEFLVKRFDTQSPVASAGGAIPGGSTVSFSIFMSKSAAAVGTMFPRFKLFVNNESSTQLCTATGAAALGATVTKYILSCTTPASPAIVLSATDTFLLWVGVSITGAPGNHSVTASVSIEGTPGGSFDSQVTAPLPQPTITSLTPNRGPKNTAIHVVGTGFGATQGASIVKFFNNVTAAATSWSATAFDTAVPVAAATGPVTVTVGGTTSGGASFTVTPSPSITSLTPSSGSNGQGVTIAGANFLASQGSSTVTFNGAAATATSWGDTSIGVTVPATATTGLVVVTVSGNTSNGVAFTVNPNITSLTPPSAGVGQAVTISGTGFGVMQGSSTVTFGGAAATATSWGNTSIGVTVPAGATTGPVVVAVGGVQSNNVTFTLVTTGTISGVITRVTGGSAISGAAVQAVLAGVTKGTTASAADGSYTIPNLDPGTYDVRVSATGFSNEVRSGTNVSVGATTTVGVSMLQPGSLSGRVTQTNGITPIAGAAVTLYSGPTPKGSAVTNGSGDYSITSVRPSPFTVQAANVGYRTKQQGVTVTENNTAIANLSLDPAATGPVSYVYDELNRLVQVTDPAGESAIYHYDAVGNLTAIERPGSSGVSISAFTPHSGLVGTPVTILGTGFSTTPAQNAVTFGGTAAAVTSATATQLVTTVPAGLVAGSYTVGVTTPGGSATRDAFLVTAVSAAPTISGFTPAIAVAGTALTVNGTSFEPIPSNNNLSLNGVRATITAATSTTLSTSVPAAGSGHLSLATPGGQAVSSQDLFVPFGTHVAGDVGFTGRVVFGGTQTVALNTPNQIGLLLFDASAGQRVSVQLSASTFATCTLYLLGPSAQQLASSGCTNATTFVDSVGLPTSGTYAIGIEAGASTGTVAVTLNDATDVTGPITIDGPTVPVTTTTAGQDARLTFSAAAGQRVTVRVTNVANPGAHLNLVRPDGTAQASVFFCSGCGNAFIDTQTLAAGTYTLWVQHAGTNIGSETLQLSSVAPDVTGSITIDGPTVPVTTTTPGQDARLTFSATAGQRVTVRVTDVSSAGAYLNLMRPDGTAQASVFFCSGCGNAFLDTQTLVAGTYTLWVQHAAVNIGSETLQLSSVAPDVTGSITIDGPTVPVTTTTPGQDARLTFSATAGQRITVRVPSVANAGAYFNLMRPDGTAQASVFFCSGCGSAFIDTQILVAGTYTLWVQHAGTNIGTETLQLSSVAPDVTGSITIDGPTVPVTTTTPGQDARLTFSATAGQRVTVGVTDVSSAGAYLNLVRPDGTTQASVFFCSGCGNAFIDTETLVAGTYTLWVQHAAANIGSETLQLSSVP
jgi:YD repeat-containing protein